jgi:hypothetical protein
MGGPMPPLPLRLHVCRGTIFIYFTLLFFTLPNLYIYVFDPFFKRFIFSLADHFCLTYMPQVRLLKFNVAD